MPMKRLCALAKKWHDKRCKDVASPQTWWWTTMKKFLFNHHFTFNCLLIACKVLSNFLGRSTTMFAVSHILASLILPFFDQHTHKLIMGINYTAYFLCFNFLIKLCHSYYVIMACRFSRCHTVTLWNILKQN